MSRAVRTLPATLPSTRDEVIAMLTRSHIPVTEMTVAWWLAQAKRQAQEQEKAA